MNVNLEDVRKYPVFEDFCDNVYCANKNPWACYDEDCEQCKLNYNIGLTLVQQGKAEGIIVQGEFRWC